MTGGLDGVVDGSLTPGRYRLSGPISLRDLRTSLTKAGWYDAVVSGRAMHDRESMFEQFATSLRFPEWFGHNWDAFADCLQDLSWLSGAGVAVLWQHYAMFARAAPDLAERTGEIIDDAIQTRVDGGLPPLFVIYPGAAHGTTGSKAWRLRPVVVGQL